MAKVLITGVSGQDGSYMSELCLSLGHQVFGVIRRTSTINDLNYKHLLPNPNFKVVYGDLLDGVSIDNIVREIKPDYFINFAAQSFVGASWEIPEETFMAGAVGVLKCLEALRKNVPECRFYNAGSSEQFGDVIYCPQDEKHPFRPRSPYGAAKCAAQNLVKVYRESYGLYAIQGLLFNHESERRGEEFVTRKITKGITRILQAIYEGKPFEPIKLGNLDAKRDWSHSEDFVDGVWRMLNQDKYNPTIAGLTLPLRGTRSRALSSHIKEYILASGETHSVREFINKALGYANIEGYWQGTGTEEKFYLSDFILDSIKVENSVIISIDPKLFRPAEVDILLGDPSEAKKDLKWEPKNSFDNLVKRMVLSDLHGNKKIQKQEPRADSSVFIFRAG
jgi:GDPmannose 4,6-dehydratase